MRTCSCSCRGDDDLPPKNCSWITNAVRIFEKWHSVGIVGIRHYTTW